MKHQSTTEAESQVALTSNLVVYPEGEEAIQYVLNATRISLGRGPGSQIRVNHSAISGSHLELVKNDSGNYEVSDHGSSNGLCINGETVTRAILKDGDRLLIGGAVAAYFLILPDDAEAVDPVVVAGEDKRTTAERFAGLAERTCNLEAECKRHQRRIRKLESEIEKVGASLLRFQNSLEAPSVKAVHEPLATVESGSKPVEQQAESESDHQVELVNRLAAHSNATSNTAGVKVSSGRN